MNRPDRILSYEDLDSVFDGIYLESSFVLDLSVTPKLIVFEMEFVLLEAHDCYTQPLEDEIYCFHRGRIRFLSIQSIEYRYFGLKPAIDATGSQDFGNIDTFVTDGNSHKLMGDWGELVVTSIVKVNLYK